jgi:hypothetical protein
VTYRWLDDLDLALAAGGVPYTPVGFSTIDPTGATDWSTRGRPYSTGDFTPQGVLCHHTASPAGTSDQADLNGILCGNSQAPGPVSQLYIGRTGIVYLVAAGRCNHGGQGIRPGVDNGCSDMNAALLGIEVGNSGVGEWWPKEQTDAYAATVAALCEWYQWPTDAVWFHATTGPPSGGCNSKIDPAGPWDLQPDLPGGGYGTWDLDVWRAHVDTYRAGAPQPPEDPLSALSDDQQLELFAKVEAIFWMLGNQYPTAEGAPLTISSKVNTVHTWSEAIFWMVGNTYPTPDVATVSSDARIARENTERLLESG